MPQPDHRKPIPHVGHQSPAVDFIDNHLPRYHEMFANAATRYSPVSGQYTPVQLVASMESTSSEGGKAVPSSNPSPRPQPSTVADMSFWQEIFPSAMESIKVQYPTEPKGRADTQFCIRSLTTWTDVYSRLLAARQMYENPEGLIGSVKKGMRKTVDNSQWLRGVVGLVPDMDMTTTVTSVLRVLLDAAKKSTDIRRTITDGLEDLEKNFEDVEFYISMFPNDKNITQASVDMVGSIFKAVEDVIGYFIKNKVTKALSIVFNGEEYKQSLTKSLEQIVTSSKDLIHQAQNSNIWQNRKVLETTFASSMALTQVVSGQQRLADSQNEMKSLLDELGLNLSNLQRQNEYLAGQVIYYQNTSPRPSFPSQQASMTQASLLSMLNLASPAMNDIEYVLASKELVSMASQEAINQLLVNHGFREWLVSPASHQLLVHGDFEGTQYVSALSLFCASFVQTVKQMARYSTLVHFCGRHLEGDDYCRGGSGMIRSLVVQLLQQYHFDLRLLGEKVPNIPPVQDGDSKQLMALFRFLVLQLRDTAIFCVIDGIKYYEREEIVDDMGLVLGFLLDMAKDEDCHVAFKVVVTSPSPTRIVRHAFSEDRIVSLSGQSGSGQGFSASGFARSFSDSMNT